LSFTIPTVTIVGNPTLAPNIPSPWAAGIAWDTITIQGVTWQGLFEIDGAALRFKLDPKDAPGIVGQTTTKQGSKPKPFRITFFEFADSRWPAFLSFLQTVLPASSTTQLKQSAVPVSIQTPALDLVGIDSVLVEEIGAPKKNAGPTRDMLSITLSVLPYQPPVLQNATATPSGASNTPPNTPGKQPSTAGAALQAQIEPQRATSITADAVDGLPR
jgi:hypothetical protein